MAKIKKAQPGTILKAAGKAAGNAVKKAASNIVKKVSVASSRPSSLGKDAFGEFSDQFIGRKPSADNIKKAISFDYSGKKVKYKKGGVAKAKSGVIAKKGSKVKKAFNGTTTMAQRSMRAAKPVISPASDRRKSRAAVALNPTMKKGGKVGAKKMKSGGKCRGGCY